ncbi:ATP-binding protein [Oceanidesulfovibrio marinus]|uniref:histidine kinase n=1 Tax=Oceanidesulfovibrio marinus TaxID=370038 RepID=A0A6P1ZL92_9BACT|nr:ATP-binding protein [Oceanidesulfovibrio marinus]TVM36552.1 two-component sensor histidine kinase [Oceanidesulfovibrio marinus]
MKIGIKHRLFFIVLTASVIVAVGMMLLTLWSIGRGFRQYVNNVERERLERLATSLEASYGQEGGWEHLRDNPREWSRLVLQSVPERIAPRWVLDRLQRRLGGRPLAELLAPQNGTDLGEGDEPTMSPALAQLFQLRVFLQDADHTMLVGPEDRDPDLKQELLPLRFQGNIVGYVGLMQRKRLVDRRQLVFLRQQKVTLAIIAGFMLLVSALLSRPFANRLVRPIRALAEGTHRLAAGNYETRVQVERRDELGQLARDFNRLAMTLEQNESARRQWVADISHELRTPLSILRGELEGLQDGVRQATPEAINSLHGEVLRLGRLVDDLYQLAVSDVGALTYRKEPVELAEVFDDALEPFASEFEHKGIALQYDRGPDAGRTVFADAERLHQLFGNLLENSVKYTDPGGAVEVRLEYDGGRARVHILDSAPGVPERELGRLFERLYRVEGSRSRETGGAGLGLAICRNIAEAHEGTVAAHTSPLGGVWITVDLPTEEH